MADKKEGLVRAAAVEFEPDKVAVIGGEEIGTTPKKAPEEFQSGKLFNLDDAEKMSNLSPVVKEEAKKRKERAKALKQEKTKEAKDSKDEQSKQ